MKTFLFCALALSCGAFPARAEVKLNPFFTDDMVVQRDLPLPVYGTARPGEQVRVVAGATTARTLTDRDGNWEVKLPPRSLGPAFEIAVQGDNRVVLRNVIAGDVWLCGGQSNMEFGVANAQNAPAEIAAANYPGIRFFRVEYEMADEPRSVVSGGPWHVVSPATVAGLSAVGYFFGREVHRKTGVTIGLINSNWNGTVAEAWTSREALSSVPELKYLLDRFSPMKDGTDLAKDGASRPQDRPTVLFNAKIAPLTRSPIRGVLWYQGENNAGRAFQYRTLLPTLIRDWRSHWRATGSGDFPFYIVQLAGFGARAPQPGEDAWAEMREAQNLVARTVTHSGLATAVDIGDADNVHPKNKQEVGRRLALIALAKDYGQGNLEYSGPQLQSMQVEGEEVRLHFSHADGLRSRGEEPSFAIAGADRRFVWAKARIEGSSVVLSSPQVKNPVAARYAWAFNPATPLSNAADLPALPFRTDDWPSVTINNK